MEQQSKLFRLRQAGQEMNNADKLRQIKRDYKLTSKDVADILCCEEFTVISWLRNPESESHRNMNDGRLRHLKLALRGRKKK